MRLSQLISPRRGQVLFAIALLLLVGAVWYSTGAFFRWVSDAPVTLAEE
jgi:hypothetical protein